jgi:hypothetical protein
MYWLKEPETGEGTDQCWIWGSHKGAYIIINCWENLREETTFLYKEEANIKVDHKEWQRSCDDPVP